MPIVVAPFQDFSPNIPARFFSRLLSLFPFGFKDTKNSQYGNIVQLVANVSYKISAGFVTVDFPPENPP